MGAGRGPARPRLHHVARPEGTLDPSKPDDRQTRDAAQSCWQRARSARRSRRFRVLVRSPTTLVPSGPKAIRKQLGLNAGDAAFFVAGDPDMFWKFSGLARTKLGEELNLIDKARFELAWIVDFPMYEYSEEDRRSTSRTTRSRCRRAAWRRCKPRTPLTIKAFQYDITCNGYEIASGGIRNQPARGDW